MNQNIDPITSISKLESLLHLYDEAPCGTLTFQKDGLILDANTTLVRWLGYEKEEVLGKRTFSSFLKIGGQIYFETHFFPLIQLQGHINEIYFDFKCKDNSEFRGLVNVRSVPSTENNPMVYQAVILDVSKRWHYEDELRKAKNKAEADSEAKAKLLATISHEIRTPLNAILGIGNLLHQTPLNKNQEEYARLLLHSSEHLLSLVNNLLDLSKIEANKYELSKKPFNLQDVLKILDQTFAVKALEKNIMFAIDFTPNESPTYLEGDVIKLKQILINLIGNALKFTKEGGVSLMVSILDDDPSEVQLRFEVIDTGIGIPPEKLDTIFGEFSQASQDINTEYGGTGLGLTISKKLLELHDADLIVTSEIGSGSCFQFDISYKKCDVDLHTINDSSSLIDTQNFEGYKVLVVDDNDSNLFIASQYLEQYGVPFSTANSGDMAIKMIKLKCPDLVLLDLHMPKKDGYTTAKEIRSLALTKQPIIVAFSASTVGSVQKKLEEVGIEDFLPKPFLPNQLLEVLSTYLCKKPDSSVGKLKNVLKKDIAPISHYVPTVHNKSFSLERYKKMAQNKPEYLKKFIISTRNGLLKYNQDFKEAVESKDESALSELIHKSTMTFHYIQADKLSLNLKMCREHLCNDDNQSFEKNVQLCSNEFNLLIEEFEKLITSKEAKSVSAN